MSFGFLIINLCNHGEHYETPPITLGVLTVIVYPKRNSFQDNLVARN
jgi:hypothetical protein